MVGTASQLDVAQQESLLATQRAAMPPLEIALRQNAAALAVLVGRAPENFSVRGGGVARIRVPPVTPGLPSDILDQRPDIRQAEAALCVSELQRRSGARGVLPEHSAHRPERFPKPCAGRVVRPRRVVLHRGRQPGPAGVRWLPAARSASTCARPSAGTSAIVPQSCFVGFQRCRTGPDRGRTAGHPRKAANGGRPRLAAGVPALRTAAARRHCRPCYRSTTQQTLFQAQDTLAQVRFARLQAVTGLFQALGGGWPPLTKVEAGVAVRCGGLNGER